MAKLNPNKSLDMQACSLSIAHMTNEQFNQIVNRDIRRLRSEVKADGTFDQIPSEAAEQMQREGWASMEDQREYWTSRDDGRSDGYGESYGERQ